MNTPAALSWNVVARHFHPHDQLRARLRQKLDKLACHLTHFPPDAVHLQIVLEKNPRKTLFTAALTLRLPSSVLNAGKSAPDPVTAFDHAIKALLREIESHKADLRRESAWKSKGRRAELRRLKPLRFETASLSPTAGPHSRQEIVAGVLQQNEAALLRYVSRQLRHDETTGDLPPGAIDPTAVVDEVARRALAMPQRKPEPLGYLQWLYTLARRELQRRRRTFRTQARDQVPLDASGHPADEAESDEADRPLDIITAQATPPRSAQRALLADTTEPRPDDAAAGKDLLEYLQKAASAWPRSDREVFELYFVEGFEPDEIAMIVGVPLEKAKAAIASIQERLRAELLRQSAV